LFDEKENLSFLLKRDENFDERCYNSY
jgi:hypothetical protein